MFFNPHDTGIVAQPNKHIVQGMTRKDAGIPATINYKRHSISDPNDVGMALLITHFLPQANWR